MLKSNSIYDHIEKILKKNNVSDYGSNRINVSYSTGNYEEYFPEHDSRIFKWRKESVNGNANAIIGGGMVFMVITIVFVVFYFSHRSLKNRASSRQRQWLENDATLDVYTVDQFFDNQTNNMDVVSELPPLLPTTNHYPCLPPPSYEAVIASDIKNNYSGSQNAYYKNYTYVKKCKLCFKEIENERSHLNVDNDDQQYCQCSLKHDDSQVTAAVELPLLSVDLDTATDHMKIQNDNCSSTTSPASTSFQDPAESFNNIDCFVSDDEANNNISNISEGIDKTGLPSYDTAAKIGNKC